MSIRKYWEKRGREKRKELLCMIRVRIRRERNGRKELLRKKRKVTD